MYFTLLFTQIYDIMSSHGYEKYPKIYSLWEGESYEDKEKQQKMAAGAGNGYVT